MAVNGAVLEAVELALAGDALLARTRLTELWTVLSQDDFFHRCVVAHYLADLQPDADAELRWDQLALQAALAASPASFENQIPGVTKDSFLPSLHLNLASSYERNHDFGRASQHAALAADALASLPWSPSTQTTQQAILRIVSRLAVPSTETGLESGESEDVKWSRMERKYVARASIEIAASSAVVWDALVNPATAKEYFFGAVVRSDWREGSPITFTGEFNGNAYHEKGTILQVRPERLLQYNHWSDLDQLPDLPENYRNWTFRIESRDPGVVLSVTEDNIPDEIKRARSEEFWSGVLSTIKRIVSG